MEFWLSILGIIIILTTAVLFLPLANKLNFPYTVLLALVGVVLGFIIDFNDGALVSGLLHDPLRALGGLDLTSEIVFFLFLPALVFESALSIDVRRLMDDVVSIVFLAVIGLLISTFVIGFSLNYISGVDIIVCLLLGCIVSATDPVAVVALFKELAAPKRLTILVEGESLFNDATAIVLFSILLSMVVASGGDNSHASGEVSLLSGIWEFVRVFAGGIIVGYIVGRAFTSVIGILRNLTLVCITLSISLAYISFIVAEHYLHVSGVMAVVTAGLIMGSVGRTIIPPDGFHALHESWHQIGFWANSIIFVLVGLAVPELLAAANTSYFFWLGIVLIVALVSRVAVIFGLVPLLGRFGLGARVSKSFRAVMVWGGLRGAVSLALALAVFENTSLPSEVRELVAVLVTGFVMFTLFVQATTIRPLMGWLGLNQLAPSDVTIRDRAMAQTMLDVSKNVSRTFNEYEVQPTFADSLLSTYNERAEHAKNAAAVGSEQLTDENWLQVAIASQVSQEKKHYYGQFGDAFISATVLSELQVMIDDMSDSLKSGGLDGFRKVASDALDFGAAFRFAMYLQRKLGWTKGLSRALRTRFETLSAMRLAVKAQLASDSDALVAMVGQSVANKAKSLSENRLRAIETSLSSIRLQYPEYSKDVQERSLRRVALRLEGRDYDALLKRGLISEDVKKSLNEQVRESSLAFGKEPELDLGLEPSSLVKKVAFLADLPGEKLVSIVKLLKPVLTMPGEKIISKGDIGNTMYFVSSGSVEVETSSEPVQLGTGEFFGEIALLDKRPRVADVTSLGFCQLLSLHRNDFIKFLDANPAVKTRVETAVAERLENI